MKHDSQETVFIGFGIETLVDCVSTQNGGRSSAGIVRNWTITWTMWGTQKSYPYFGMSGQKLSEEKTPLIIAQDGRNGILFLIFECDILPTNKSYNITTT